MHCRHDKGWDYVQVLIQRLGLLEMRGLAFTADLVLGCLLCRRPLTLGIRLSFHSSGYG